MVDSPKSSTCPWYPGSSSVATRSQLNRAGGILLNPAGHEIIATAVAVTLAPMVLAVAGGEQTSTVSGNARYRAGVRRTELHRSLRTIMAPNHTRLAVIPALAVLSALLSSPRPGLASALC